MSIFMQSAPRNLVLINRHNSVVMFDIKVGTTNASVIHSMAVLIVNTVSITVPPSDSDFNSLTRTIELLQYV